MPVSAWACQDVKGVQGVDYDLRRHDGSGYSCNEIRIDYYLSGLEKFYKEYGLYCKDQDKISRGDVRPEGDYKPIPHDKK